MFIFCFISLSVEDEHDEEDWRSNNHDDDDSGATILSEQVQLGSIDWRSWEQNRLKTDRGETQIGWKTENRESGTKTRSRNIVCRISVKLIYEHSSTDGTCVSPLVRACIKIAHWAQCMYRVFIIQNTFCCLLSLSLPLSPCIYSLCLPNCRVSEQLNVYSVSFVHILLHHCLPSSPFPLFTVLAFLIWP